MRMKRWCVVLLVVAIFVFITALFLTPDFTYHCSEQLFECVEMSMNKGFWSRLSSHFVCVLKNVVCVLGGLF